MTGKCKWPRCTGLWYCTWLVDELAHHEWASCITSLLKFCQISLTICQSILFLLPLEDQERDTLWQGCLAQEYWTKMPARDKKQTSWSTICRVQTDKAIILPHLQLLKTQRSSLSFVFKHWAVLTCEEATQKCF